MRHACTAHSTVSDTQEVFIRDKPVVFLITYVAGCYSVIRAVGPTDPAADSLPMFTSLGQTIP